MTDFPDDLSIDRLAARVLDTSLPHGEWTHAAHFAFAIWVERTRPDLAEPKRFREIVMRLNEAHGRPNSDTEGYHHTITLASLRAARFTLGEMAAGMPLHHVLRHMLAGPFGRSDWILAYWSRELLFDREARRCWVPPDQAVLPF
jgi:hypothetical protein